MTQLQNVEKQESLATLFIKRAVVNANEIIEWAKSQGFATTLPASDLHVIIAFSRKEVDWDEINDDVPASVTIEGNDNERIVTHLGDGGAVVLMFESPELQARHQELLDEGLSFDFASFHPHITISFDASDVDVDNVEPFDGDIILGPEQWEEVIENFKQSIVEKTVTAKVVKVDEGLGLVFGWAIVSKLGRKPYFDVQGDHIPEPSMLRASFNFMKSQRIAKEMHVGDSAGIIVFAWPLTSDIAKAMGLKTKKTGLMIAMHPDDPAVLAKFASGEYTGFSIGGIRLSETEVDEASLEAMKGIYDIEDDEKTKSVHNRRRKKKVKKSPVNIHVHMPDIHNDINIPEQAAPIIKMPDLNIPPQPTPIFQMIEPNAPVVKVEPAKVEVNPNVTIEQSQRGVEKTVVTKHDDKGRIVEFEKTFED